MSQIAVGISWIWRGEYIQSWLVSLGWWAMPSRFIGQAILVKTMEVFSQVKIRNIASHNTIPNPLACTLYTVDLMSHILIIFPFILVYTMITLIVFTALFHFSNSTANARNNWSLSFIQIYIRLPMSPLTSYLQVITQRTFPVWLQCIL